MLKNVIFEYMGVLANVDYKQILSKMSLLDKFKALRIVVGLKKNPVLKNAWNSYQMGQVSQNDLYDIGMQVYPKSASVIPTMLSLIPDSIKENKSVLSLAKKLHDDGFKIILLSNSIPETQIKIQNSEFVNYFDGFVLSHLVGLAKPSQEIYDFTCDVYEINPQETIFVDDTPENLIGAKSARLKTMLCEKPAKLAKRLGNLFYSKYQPEPNE